MSAMELMACVLALCLAGMLLLSQAMDRHCEQVVRRGEPGRVRRWALRLAAASLLALALWLCVQGWGAAVGGVGWLGGLSVAALLLTGLLTYAARAGAVAITLAGGMALAWTMTCVLAA